MNVIFILMDSLNRHYLSPYGCKDVATPNIGELAQRGVTFTNHIIGSAPCMPARRELMTGRREFLWRGWGHLEPFDQPIAKKCRQAGALTHMITDHYHYWENSAHGYMEFFDGFEMIRGHECDQWITTEQPDKPEWVKAICKYRTPMGDKYWRNAAHQKTEEDWPCHKVFSQAAKWLEENNKRDNFMLWVESFDPHEPHYVPEPYRSMYCKDPKPEFNCWPPYQNQAERIRFYKDTSMEELAFIRAQYQGKLTMADKALGKVWQVMTQHNMWDNTMVILTTDHGHNLAESVRDLSEIDENGRDSTLRNPYAKEHPHYMSHANIPLIVWHPQFANQPRTEDAMTTAVDMYSTILEAMGAQDTSSPHGESIFPILKGESEGRDFHYWGSFGGGICCTDGENVLLQGGDINCPLYAYSAVDGGGPGEVTAGAFIPGVDWPVWRTRWPNRFDFPDILVTRDAELYREKNIICEQPEIADALRKRVKEVTTVDGCPPEQYDRMEL